MRNASRLGVVVTAVSIVLVAVHPDAERLHALDQAGPVTIASDIAPIVFEHYPPSWAALDASPVALASAGRVREAADRARRALESAVAAGNDAAATEIRERLRSYDR